MKKSTSMLKNTRFLKASLPFGLFLMAACLIKLDRVFLKRNGGFSLHHIEGTAASNPAWDTQQPFPEEILSQPFFYLGKGSQTYVFESRDKKYVVKFYKFPSHMRKISWLRHPLAYRFDPKRIRIKEHNEKRHNLSYNSFFLASSELSEETSVVYAHLNPTEHLHRNITLVDRLKAEYTLSLDSMGFVVQRKATPLLSALQSLIEKNDIATGKKVVEGTVDLIVARCKKGITDLDSMMHDNYGWVDGRAIHIDIGRFVHDETVKEPANCQKEVVRITQVLSDYLALHSPELHDCYQKKVSAVTNQ